jgi:hypothetical protein
MRMRSDVDPRAPRELRRTQVIEKYERPDHLQAARWQYAAYHKAAEVTFA